MAKKKSEVRRWQLAIVIFIIVWILGYSFDFPTGKFIIGFALGYLAKKYIFK